MTNFVNTTQFDVKAILSAGLSSKLEAANITLTESESSTIVDTLLSRSILEVTKVADLGDFVHYTIQEGSDAPQKSILVNNIIFYVFSGVQNRPAHEQDYNEYLEDNELYSGDYSYGQYLEDNELVETFTEVPFTNVTTADIGQLYIGAITSKQNAEESLKAANEVLEKLSPIINSNFLPIA